MLRSSTETSVSGTSPKLPLCKQVSEYVYFGERLEMTLTHAIVNGRFSRGCVWVVGDDVIKYGREVVLKNAEE